MKKIAVVIAACALLLSGCFVEIEMGPDASVDNAVAGTNTSGDSTNIKDQMDVTIVEADGAEWRGVGVLIKNNSTRTVGELEIQVLFYNEAGDIIAEESDGHDAVLPGSTVVSYMTAPDGYDRYEYNLDVDADANDSYTNHAAKMDVKTNIGEDCIILRITNNAGVDIEEFEYAVVFYKEGKIVDVTNGIEVYSIAAGDTVVEECSTWGVDFDEYKVYINRAHTFW